MPTNLTEVDAFDATVSVPLSGDARTAASVVTALQSLANRTKYLKLHAVLDAGGTRTIAATLTLNGASIVIDCDVQHTGDLASSHILDTPGGMTLGDFIAANIIVATGKLITFVGSGHIRKRQIFGIDADHDYGINDADLIFATPTAPRTYTLSSTGAASGDMIWIMNRAPGQLLTVSAVGGDIGLKNNIGFSKAACFVYDGLAGGFVLLMAGELLS